MAMVVMVIVRTTFWMKDLIKAYVTITNNGRSGQAQASDPAMTLVLAGPAAVPRSGLRERVVTLGLQLISAGVGSHSHLWPPSLRGTSGRHKNKPISQLDVAGDVVKVAVRIAILLGLVLGLCAPAPVAASDNPNPRCPSEPKVLVMNGSQIQDLKKRAQAGEPEAQYILGSAYRGGGPILAKDLAATLLWWQKAALQGHPGAQNGLGYMYQNGEGVAQDFSQAAKWYRMAAEQGDAAAQNNLGALYFSGQGVQRSYSRAFNWLRMAASQGLATAQHGLAIMYQHGKGTSRNLAEALGLYRQAALQGLPLAQNELGSMYLRGEGVSRDPAEAFHWFQLAAEQSLPEAENNLGCLYSAGQGAGRDYHEASRWFSRAAEQGVTASQVNLGVLYINGRGVPLDYVEGYKWLSLAATQGSKSAAQAKKSLGGIMTKSQLAAADGRIAAWRQQHSAPQEQVRFSSSW